jgi:hypothetical protein
MVDNEEPTDDYFDELLALVRRNIANPDEAGRRLLQLDGQEALVVDLLHVELAAEPAQIDDRGEVIEHNLAARIRAVRVSRARVDVPNTRLRVSAALADGRQSRVCPTDY